MRRILFLLLFTLPLLIAAQYMQTPAPAEIARAPLWAQKMYSSSPNLFEVDQLYNAWVREGRFAKSYHTQYYKRWRRTALMFADANGKVDAAALQNGSSPADSKFAHRGAEEKVMGTVVWNLVGPLQVYDESGNFKGEQTNVYSLGRCLSNPDILYCGTETAIVFKSTDGGDTWNSVSHNMNIGAPGAIGVHTTNGNIAYFGSNNDLYKTTDGGASWNIVFTTAGLDAHEIYINTSDPQIVMVAGRTGLHRSTDGGTAWNTIYTEECWDIKENAADPSKVYLLKHNNAGKIAEFFLSTDYGASFTVQLAGWYSSSDPDRYDGGARLAVTPDNPNRVYAYLIGESKLNDYGFIGVWRSDDGGVNWTLPNAPAGGPYTSTHINTAIGTPTWTYHQGYYNCGLMASPRNADSLLIGGLSLYCSTDGGASWTSIAGYAGGVHSMHVDNQDFRAFPDGEAWISTDGGIYKSTDFFATQPEVKMYGIYGSDFWGFGQGWNQDVVTGGLYHNGNISWFQDYAYGDFLSLGGGEASTGYVNPGNNRLVYHSDVGGSILPLAIGSPIQWKPFGLAPNESYWAAESSELEWHPHCYNIGWLGRDHKLWKTMDGAASFSLVDSFGSDANARIAAIEVSRSNTDVMYVVQRPSSGVYGILWKTTDGGGSWATVLLPGTSTNRNRILVALSPDNADHVWIAYPSGGNGTKIYKSTNGGASWTNLTTSVLDDEGVNSIALAGGTDGGIYYCTDWTVYYRNNSMSNWVTYNSGLPYRFNTDIVRPFYRDGKIRSACYGKGIWQAPFYEQPSRPVATAMVDRFSTLCPSDSFYFDDYSMLNHAGASWSWTFEDGAPATSTSRNPHVSFSTLGMHEVTLTVTDSAGNSDSDTISVEVTGFSTTSIAEDFETSFPPLQWVTSSTGNLSWQHETAVGGYGASSKSAMANNYDVDAGGSSCDMRAPVNFAPITDAKLTFDVAYTPWGGSYSDSLEVLVSTDCGQTFVREYYRGGMDLSTTGSPLSSGAFIPAAGEWRTDTVDLNAYAGMGDIFIVFRNWGHFGQRLYLDNINLATVVVNQQPPVAAPALALAPNPVLQDGSIRIHGNAPSVKLKLVDGQGKLVMDRTVKTNEDISLAGSALAVGVYHYMMESNNQIVTGKLVVIAGR